MENGSFDSQEDLNSEDFEYSVADDDNSDDINDYIDDDDDDSISVEQNGETAANSLKQKSPTKLSRQELMKYYKLSTHVKKLKDDLKKKEKNLELTRNSLSKCRHEIAILNERLQQNKTILEDNQNNRPMLDLTGHRIQKVETEISMKKKEEEEIKQLVHIQELAISEAQLAISHCDYVQPILEEHGSVLKQQKSKQAMLRVQTQTRQVIEAQRMDSMKEKDSKNTAVKEKFYKPSHHKALKESSKDTGEMDPSLEQRIKAVLALKNSIEFNRSSLEAQQLLIKEQERKLKAEKLKERAKILEEGGNPDEVILKKRHLEQQAKHKEKFEQEQKRKQLDIIKKLVEETKAQDKRKQPLKQNIKKVIKKKEIMEEEIPFVNDDHYKTDDDINDDTQLEKDVAYTTTDVQLQRQSDLNEKSILEPDIPGLWAVTQESHKDDKKKCTKSKMELAIMEKTLNSLKKSAVITQFAAGKEFKGQAFVSKPEEIIFKDFIVGKLYKKKIQLTNVSYTVNHLKLIGVSENLTDFLQIDFKPPGAISAGLTCYLTVTFEPKLNEDITGSIDFLSQTGPVSIPVKCITKKCLISVDDTKVSFGSVYVGEMVEKSLVVYNKGALPTWFTLSLQNEPLPTSDETEPTKVNDSLITDQSKDQLSIASGSQKSIISTVEFGSNPPGSNPPMAQLYLELSTKHSQSLNNLSTTNKPATNNKDATKALPSATKSEEEEIIENPEKNDDDVNNESNEQRTDEVATESPTTANNINNPLAKNPITIATNSSSGAVEPYSSCTIDISFAPELPGKYQSCFELISSDTSIKPIYIVASGEGIDVPIYLEEELIDLKICMIDRLYQTSIVLFNSLPLQINFSIPSELQKYMDILPKYGLVQAKSLFAAQLKFFPQKCIFNEGTEVFDTGNVLKVPVTVIVSKQSSPVLLIVSATITESEIKLSQTEYDFGKCTVLESLVANISLTNKSCLPQEFGFVHLPKWLSIQPNDGFGTLLPNETLTLDIIFSPDKPNQYSSSDIVLKSAINKEYKLQCKGIGVLPALELSHSSISFAATPVTSTSVARIQISNPRLSRMNSSVIRGLAPTKAQRMFEFCIPQESPLSISPSVGVIKPGQLLDIEVTFSPVLDTQSVRDAATNLINAAAALAQRKAAEERERKAKEEENQAQTTAKKGQKGKRGPSQLAKRGASPSLNSGSKGNVASSNVSNTPKQLEDKFVVPTQTTLKEGSDIWWEAYSNVLTEYKSHVYQYSIPCFISKPIDDNQQITKSDEVIYLDIIATAIRPSLIVVSDKGRPFIDFGHIAIGDKCIKSVMLKNISSKSLKLSCKTCFNTKEGFEIRNALREISPCSTHSVLIQFAPENSRKYQETVKISYNKSSYLELSLSGQGVDPVTKITPTEGPIDWGYVMVEDTVIRNLKIENSSNLSVRFSLRTENESPSNFNGQPFFTCIPYTGVILPNSSVNIDIHFSPDRPNCSYTGSLHIETNGKINQVFLLKGCSILTNMYALGGADVGPNQLSMASIPTNNEDEEAAISYPMLFTFKCSSLEATKNITQYLHIGCIKSALVKKPKTEYVIETLQSNESNDAKCFAIDPMKSSIEAGESKQVNITFTLPSLLDKRIIQAHTNVILKGERTVQYHLLLQATLLND